MQLPYFLNLTERETAPGATASPAPSIALEGSFQCVRCFRDLRTVGCCCNDGGCDETGHIDGYCADCCPQHSENQPYGFLNGEPVFLPQQSSPGYSEACGVWD